MKKLIVVAAQMNPLLGDIEGNAQRIIEIAKEAYRTQKADIVVFPELAITGYPPEDLLFRPALYKRTLQALELIASQINKCTLVIGYPESDGGTHYNSAAVITEGQVIANYRKQHLPNYTVFDEKRYFSAGGTNCVFTVKGVKIGLLICEDLWFEGPSESVAKSGAVLIICINASPFAIDKSYARRHLLSQRAKKHGIPFIYLNQVGGQDELVFDGGSMVTDPNGALCQHAPYFEEDTLTVVFDLNNQLALLSKNIFPPEPLDEEKIYNALVLGVRDYIAKNGFPGAIIGLSGGVDSALTLAIAVDAIGPERVHAVMMPSKFTAQISLDDAQKQADTLGAKYSTIKITPVFDAFVNSLTDEFHGCSPDTTEENLQARCRGTLLMALSNKKGGIVLTTGNKSEMAVGYATLYGDMAGGFAVIKDVYKTMVYRLCNYRNALSNVIPERVITRPPSAELAEDQKDEDSLPPYAVLDDILERYINHHEDINTICQAGFDRATVERVIYLLNRNEYKRRQAPIGIRITKRAFGKDRRYPITSGFNKHNT
jgi:NAD+ synthase (glutamine-hydrolysing)